MWNIAHPKCFFVLLGLSIIYLVIAGPIGFLILKEHKRQLALPVTSCFFNQSSWELNLGQVSSSMSAETNVILNGTEYHVKAIYPAPPSLLNVKKTSQVELKASEWSNASTSCYIDLQESGNLAYPEPVGVESAAPLLLVGFPFACNVAGVLICGIMHLLPPNPNYKSF